MSIDSNIQIFPDHIYYIRQRKLTPLLLACVASNDSTI